MKILKHFWPSLILFAFIWFFNKPLGSVPALGRFFSPFEGYLQSVESKLNPKNIALEIPNLKDEVTVKYDENRVPHIFAKNEEDLYTAQGYIIAQDRIWQMEFYTLAAAGRVSEIVGEKALAFDQYNRRLGMAKTAEESIANLDPLSKKILESYANGVNAYIEQLSYKNLPIEYKLLGYKPSPWTIKNTVLMLMNMRNTLNGGTDDFRVSNVMSKYGPEATKELFTDYPLSESPIIPVGTKWDFNKLPIKEATDQIDKNVVSMNIPSANPAIGSNNWAVHGSKSATGLPILANDPHLNLTLPSIWYQMQLHAPGINTYGVALPGCPGIVIGFNKDVAWGVTNVGSDVMDFYKIKFKDASKKEYWHDGKWKAATHRIETYNIKGRAAVIDTVIYTHHGPIIYEKQDKANFNKNVPSGHAMRWVANENKGSDLLTFYHLNRAKNYADYRKALSLYVAPAQNFIFASNENDVAITANGKLPLKYKNQGKFLLDGSNPSHDWQGWIPMDQTPTVKNPPRGFVSSANQFSVDPSYPYYLGWKFAPPFRGIRINERLSAMKNANADSLRLMQNDNFNVPARRILPRLLGILQKNGINDSDLASWNLKNEADLVAPTIFETWLDLLLDQIWKDEFNYENSMMYPSDEHTFDIIEKNPTAKWFDNVDTKDKVETLESLVLSSYKDNLDSLTKHHGPKDKVKWAWANVKNTEIKHLVSVFSSFGRKAIQNGGGNQIVNATTKSTGPSWRMVVELDKGWPKAYGLYPGGQSGNPGSAYYDNMIEKWSKGELNTLQFLKNADDKAIKVSSEFTLTPKK